MVRLLFSDDKQNAHLECYALDTGVISIQIEDSSMEHDYNILEIELNKETAIRLSKELRKQIGILTEKEGKNG